MEFQTDAQRACYARITPWLTQLFGELAAPRDEIPVISTVIGSALAQTAVLPWGDDDAVVTTRSYVVTGVEPDPELMHFLLRANADLQFGGFGIDADGDIVFQHSIVGSTCDREELQASVLAVVRTADRFDDQIVARWGGQTALQRAGAPRPPRR